MDFRIQRLNAAVHHFREARDVLNGDNRYARFFQGPHGAARGDDFNAKVSQGFAQFDDARFIRYTNECAVYFHGKFLLFLSPFDDIAVDSQFIIAKERCRSDISRMFLGEDPGCQRVFRIVFVDRYG